MILKKTDLDPNILKNFRPVSNLSFISKPLEKIVANQLDNYLERGSLYEPLQSAYRKQHSTETALLKLQNDVTLELANKNSTLLVLLDLSAAFDTIDYNRLFDIMSKLGIRGTVLKWFKSYLSDRKQHITIHGSTSKETTLQCGVPQGSVLGPTCYLLYTTALGILLREQNIKYHLYADDTQLYTSFDGTNRKNAT